MQMRTYNGRHPQEENETVASSVHLDGGGQPAPQRTFLHDLRVSGPTDNGAAMRGSQVMGGISAIPQISASRTSN
jgi:hypothetical protein